MLNSSPPFKAQRQLVDLIKQPRALGRKVSDAFTLPLCATHHRQLHEAGDERRWWQAQAIDPLEVAERLWHARRAGIGPSGDDTSESVVEADGDTHAPKG